MALTSLFLGCPSWGFKDWRGSLYRSRTRAGEFLEEYARVFNAVEGNTTFYSLPTPQIVERWQQATPASFRFCFKLPRDITHLRALRGAETETADFLRRLAPLGESLGPFMIQLPPGLGPSSATVLEDFLQDLPKEFTYALEVRHPAFFRPPHDAWLEDLLQRLGVARVILDTRALASGDPAHPDVTAARHPKPRLPVSPLDSGPHPFVRFVGHPEPAVNEPWLETWAQTLASWIESGREPFFFAHCPNDLHAPGIARRLVDRLSARTAIGSLPPWPGEQEGSAQQLSLFP